MRKLFLILTASLLIIACSGGESSKTGNTTMTVHLDSVAHQNVIIEHLGLKQRTTLDTVELDDEGKGMLKFNVEDEGFFNVFVEYKSGGVVFAAHQGDQLTLKGNGKNLLFTGSVSGTPEVERMDSFVAYIQGYNFFMDSINRVFRAAQSKNMHYQMEKEINQIYQQKAMQKDRFVLNFIQANPDQLINLQAVRSLDIKLFPDVYKKVAQDLSAKFPYSPYVKQYASEVDRSIPLSKGEIAPTFTLPDLEGKNVGLDQFRGKYVLLDFWATWCRPCIQEIPFLKQAQEKFGGNNFQVVSVCVDQESKKPLWKTTVENHQANWTHLYDSDGLVSSLYKITHFGHF